MDTIWPTSVVPSLRGVAEAEAEQLHQNAVAEDPHELVDLGSWLIKPRRG
jgi:hypothetical protein